MTLVLDPVPGERSRSQSKAVNIHPVLPVSPDYYLPKDEMEFYQFCYVDSSGQVRGASTPFCFRKSGDHSMEGGGRDDDLLVVTTQVRERETRSLQELSCTASCERGQ